MTTDTFEPIPDPHAPVEQDYEQEKDYSLLNKECPNCGHIARMEVVWVPSKGEYRYSCRECPYVETK